MSGRFCHDRGEAHDFDRVPGRINAARRCRNCPAISLDWDCAYCGADSDDWDDVCPARSGEPCSGIFHNDDANHEEALR